MTGHFTSYETRTDHELATLPGEALADLSYQHYTKRNWEAKSEMGNRRFTRRTAVTVLVAAGLAPIASRAQNSRQTAVKFGISPYQDTAMPVIGKQLGIFEKHGIDVDLVTIAWENVIPSLASNGTTIDIALGSINTFLPRAENIDIRGGADVVFIGVPFYVFKGAAFVASQDSKIRPFSDFLAPSSGNRSIALKEAMGQLKGKRIGYPPGTPYEQMFLLAVKEGGLKKSDFDIRSVQIADGLPALLSGALDVVGAGVTQRTEAQRHGGYVFMTTEDLGFAEIVGLMSTRRYVQAHSKLIDDLQACWFETVDTLFSDVDRYAPVVLNYLAANASTKYTLQEYKTALGFQEFPRSVTAADELFDTATSRFYWKRTWDIVNAYLVETNQLKAPIPYSYYVSG